MEFADADSTRIYETVIQSLQESCAEPLYPGDERRIFGEALASVLVGAYSIVNDAARQKMLSYARGEVLDALGERSGTTRLLPANAVAIVRFLVEGGALVNIIIPAGTKVTSDGTRYFATNSIAVLQSGDDHIDLAVTAVEGGSSYNGIASDEIRTLVDLVPYVTSVSSLTETSGGDDGETYTDEGDDRYRERIRLSAARFSTAGPIRSYEYWALSADPDIETVAVITPAPGEVTLIPVMRGGTMPTQDVLDKVLAVCNADDVRPMTDFVRVSAPTPVMYDIDIHYYTTIADEAACVETIEGEGDAIGHYIAAQSAAMGLDINPDLLRKYLLAPAKGTGALRVDVAAPVFSVLDAQSLAVFSGNVSVSHEVVEP